METIAFDIRKEIDGYNHQIENLRDLRRKPRTRVRAKMTLTQVNKEINTLLKRRNKLLSQI